MDLWLGMQEQSKMCGVKFVCRKRVMDLYEMLSFNEVLHVFLPH